MIVSASKLQRTITYTGIDKVLKISIDASGYLKRLGRLTREADSVTNLVTNLKAELDKVPSSEQDTIGFEVAPDVARAWLTCLTEYTRAVTLLEKKVNAQPELGGIRNANSAEDAADKLAAQMQDQLSLPIQSLDSIVAEQDKRSKEDDDDIAKDPTVVDAPHRGVETKADAPADAPKRAGSKSTKHTSEAKPTKDDLARWKEKRTKDKAKAEPPLPIVNGDSPEPAAG